MDKLNSVKEGYNVFPNARSSLGNKLSPEAKAKISAARKGVKLSATHRAAISAGVDKNRIRSPEEIARRSVSATGKKHTKATREKIREKATGRVISPATRAKLSAVFKGRKQSESQKLALAIAHIGAKRSDEAKAKMSAAQKLRFKTNPPKRDENGKLL